MPLSHTLHGLVQQHGGRRDGKVAGAGCGFNVRPVRDGGGGVGQGRVRWGSQNGHRWIRCRFFVPEYAAKQQLNLVCSGDEQPDKDKASKVPM
jgi:hypothetical protein